MHQSFSTVCPLCGVSDRLVVTTLQWYGRIPLTEDGFAFPDAETSNTEDEQVFCDACRQEFPLAEITL